MGVNWTMVPAQYHSDDGNTYVVGLRSGKATAGGFTGAALGTKINIPRGMYMRHVYGVDAFGNRIKLPIASASNSLFVAGGSFTVGAVTYNTQGAIGERRLDKV